MNEEEYISEQIKTFNRAYQKGREDMKQEIIKLLEDEKRNNDL